MVAIIGGEFPDNFDYYCIYVFYATNAGGRRR